MSAIAVVMSQVPGNANSSLELVRRLRAAGHQVTPVSPFDLSGLTLTSALEVEMGPPGKVPVRAHRARPGPVGRLMALGSRISGWRDRSSAQDEIIDSWKLAEFMELPPIIGADLLLIDLELPLHIIAAVGSGATVAVWTPHFSVYRRRGGPPLDSRSVPGRRSDLVIDLEWRWFLIRKWLHRQRVRVTRVGQDPTTILARTAQRWGFDFSRDASLRHWFHPAVFPSLPLISFTAGELEFPHADEFPILHAGPMLREFDDAAAGVERIEAIAANARQAGKKLIYCSFGTWHDEDDRDFYNLVFEAVARRGDWEAIVGLGARIEESAFDDVAPEVHLFGFAPQREALRHCDLAIGHGGINTVNECLASGVPMLLFPLDDLDRWGTATRMDFHGVAKALDRAEVTNAKLMGEAIEAALEDDAMLGRAQELAALFAGYVEQDVAVAVIEGLLSSNPGASA